MTFYVFQNSIFVPTPRLYRVLFAFFLAVVALLTTRAIGLTLTSCVTIATAIAWFFSATSGSLLSLRNEQLICTHRFFGFPEGRVALTDPRVSVDIGWDFDEIVVTGDNTDARFSIQTHMGNESEAVANAIIAWLSDPR